MHDLRPRKQRITQTHNKALNDTDHEHYKKGIKVSINPDNDTVSNTNIIEEYKWVIEHTNLTIDDIANMNKSAIRGAFISPQEKSKLISKILKKDEKKR